MINLGLSNEAIYKEVEELIKAQEHSIQKDSGTGIVSANPINLIKAVWTAGFLIGKQRGADEAVAYEWGSSPKAQGPEEAWIENVEWRIDGKSNDKLDITNLELWHDIY